MGALECNHRRIVFFPRPLAFPPPLSLAPSLQVLNGEDILVGSQLSLDPSRPWNFQMKNTFLHIPARRCRFERSVEEKFWACCETLSKDNNTFCIGRASVCSLCLQRVRKSDLPSLLVALATFGLTFASCDDMHGHGRVLGYV